MNEDVFGFLGLYFKELLLSHLSKSDIQFEIISGHYVDESMQLS